MKRVILSAVAVLLASCLLHGHGMAQAKPYKVSNYPSHSSSFFGKLLSGRVWVFENPDLEGYADVPHAVLYDASGKRIRCIGHRTGSRKLHWVDKSYGRWEVEEKFEASLRYVFKQKRPGFFFFYYDPDGGTLANESATEDKNGEVVWTRPSVGWVQDSWPRMFADGCPGIELPAGMKVNEKQTSSSLRELRRQDPDAVIRHFPGSELTGPGRVGIAERGTPTTTREEVWAFLNAQEGNVMLGPQGHGRVFVRGVEGVHGHAVWGLKDEGGIAWIADLVEYEEAGRKWFAWKYNGKVVARYRMGDPLPYLPTGRRHGAWQLTDKLIARAEPVPLPWMGKRFEGYRFLFHDKTLTVVTPTGDYLTGGWTWSAGNLVVWVEGDKDGARSIGWRDLAHELGTKPAVVTRAMLNGR